MGDKRTPEEERARRLKGAETRRKVLELRRLGYTYARIAAEVGISETHACRIVNREIRRLNERAREEADVIVRLELERLDALQAALWDQAMSGHLGAVDRVLRIMERRAKLLGLDQVQQPAQPEPRIEIVMPRASDE